jgi:Tol biopolymer transport system component
VTFLAGIAVLVVAAVIAAALQRPAAWVGAAPPDATRFDYGAARVVEFGTLTEQYIRSVLRRDQSPLAGFSTDERAAASPAASPVEAANPSAAVRVDVTHDLTNDHFEHAYDIQGVGFRAQSDTTDATRQPGEPAGCFPRGATTWYRYRPDASVSLFANTFGSATATALAVFSGDHLDDLRLLRCDANAAGNAQAGLTVEVGATYYFQLTSMVRGGPTVFELVPVGRTDVISVTPTGAPPDGVDYNHPEISGDGRYVVYSSNATNLTDAAPRCDGQRCSSVYLRDRVAATTMRVVAAAPGAFQYDTDPVVPFFATISSDGRYVGFNAAANAFPGRPPDAPPDRSHVYVYDRATSRYSLVSRNSDGEPASTEPASCQSDGPGCELFGSTVPSLSADARYVAFHSDGNNMGGPYRGPTPVATINVYVRDRVTGVTRLASIDPSGEPFPGGGHVCKGRNVSDDGRYVAFTASTGTAHEMWATSAFSQVYLWDAQTGRSRAITQLAPDISRGSYCPTISADGGRIGFVSRDALVADDTNGTADAYVYDVATDVLRRVSVTSAGEQTNDPNVAGDEGNTFIPTVTLSRDGRFVAFDSAAPNVVPGSVGSTTRTGEEAAGPRQSYVHDLDTGATVLVSVSSTGEPLAGESVAPYVSGDGRSVAFINRGRVMVHRFR